MKETTTGGFSFGTVLFIIFLILKLTHTIDWSWWWVTSPLWLFPALVIVILLLAGIIWALIRTFS